MDVSDEVLSSSSKQCWWRSQLDIWSCEYKFWVYRLYKESISKELSNDLNLHSMTKLLDCMYAIAIYTGCPKKNGVQLQISIIQRWLDRLKWLIFYFEAYSFLFLAIFHSPIFKKKYNDNKVFSASGHFKMHEKRYWFPVGIWKP